ncbi:MAG: methionine adenosyltransferase [Erysipelotrichaceae bacterium]
MKHLFTSESVTSGHPDKICDWVSDHILDAALYYDPNSKMAVETTIKDNFILIYGEANTKAEIDYAAIAKNVLKKVGHEEEFEVLVKVSNQSAEINHAVEQSETAAGDQGLMFGYACNETEDFMPLPIHLAHRLAERLEQVRRETPCLRPDGKTQVTVEYDGDIPKRVETIVVSTQHTEDVSQDEIKEIIMEKVIKPSIDAKYLDENTNYLINPSGSFIVGGPFGDSGTTGRKIVVDTYGGKGHIGGGCFSSKDPSKVDRSAAYYTRFVAKNIVANGLCDKIEVQVAYAIGKQNPVSVNIETFNTNHIEDEKIIKIIEKNFDFSVGNIIKQLDLLQPIYHKTSNYGHFGKPGFKWEEIIDLDTNV